MKRRNFLASLPVLGGGVTTAALAQGTSDHDHRAMSGPLAIATVSFGQWQTAPPFDRFPKISDRTRNHHTMTPAEVTIKAGGAVNFINAGFHQIVVYGDGTQPGQIDVSNTIPVSVPPGPPLINDPTNRVYRGLDPSALLGVQDRVEVVHFPEPGTYLVICGVLSHFLDGMFGFVRVLP